MWEQDAEPFLTGGVGLVPLAPLAKIRKSDLPNVVRRMRTRFDQEPPLRAEKLETAAFLLMGMRYSEDLTNLLWRGSRMRESVTYQAILREGREEGLVLGRQEGLQAGLVEGSLQGARHLLMRIGRKHGLPAPDPATIAALEAIHDLDRLEALGERLLDPGVRTWRDLLEGNPQEGK